MSLTSSFGIYIQQWHYYLWLANDKIQKMKFGSVADAELRYINFTLPPEPDFNAKVLSGKRIEHPKVYVGAAKWGNADWVGKFYPAKTPATRYRELYPSQFNAVELNATHYNIYEPGVLRKWAEAAKEKDFKFCPKFPQQISHHSNFKNIDAVTEAFLQSIAVFEDKLGPVFLQLSEHHNTNGRENLYQYLASLPRGFQYFLEIRHHAWLSEKSAAQELFEFLRQHDVGLVITDTPARRDLTHMHLTAPKLFLRFVCNSLHPSSFSRTDDWIQRIAFWLENGLQETYIFLHPGDDAAVPELAIYWTNELNKHCGLRLKPPQALQPTLF